MKLLGFQVRVPGQKFEAAVVSVCVTISEYDGDYTALRALSLKLMLPFPFLRRVYYDGANFMRGWFIPVLSFRGGFVACNVLNPKISADIHCVGIGKQRFICTRESFDDAVEMGDIERQIAESKVPRKYIDLLIKKGIIRRAK